MIRNSRKLPQRVVSILGGILLLVSAACQQSLPGLNAVPTASLPTPTTVRSAVGFGFVFQWSECGSYTLDTHAQRLSLTTNFTPPTTQTIHLTLAPEELDQIAQKMDALDLFHYPDEFKIWLPPDAVRVYSFTAHYSFEVQKGNQRKILHWDDEFSEPKDQPWTDPTTQPSKAQAARLRELIQRIQQLVQVHPEFNQLPPPGACA